MYMILHRNPGPSSRWTTNHTPDYMFDTIAWAKSWINDQRVAGNRDEYLIVIVKAILVNYPGHHYYEEM